MKHRLLPEAMLLRWPPMLLWLVAIAYTTFDHPEMATTTGVFGLLGVAVAMLLYVLWGPRTRPQRNAFWFLIHVIFMAAIIALAGAKPLLAAVAAIPVGLLWLHDSPASPTAMLSWGVLLVLWPPDFWSDAEAGIAWNVMFAVVLLIAAAQFERNRLAARQYTQSGIVFSILRLVGVLGLSMLFVAGREGLRAVNAFTYIGIDASGVAGKITMLAIVAISLTVALALFRVRPEKAPKVVAPGVVDPRTKPIDFDEPSPSEAKARQGPSHLASSKPSRKPATRASDKPGTSASGKAGSRSTRQGSKPARNEPAQPGDLDFD